MKLKLVFLLLHDCVIVNGPTSMLLSK